MPGAGAPTPSSTRPGVIRLEKGVPRTESVPVEVALDDQGRLLFLKRIPLFKQKTVEMWKFGSEFAGESYVLKPVKYSGVASMQLQS